MRRRLLTLLSLAVGFVLVAGPGALARYRGTDVLANISPDSLLGSSGASLMDRYSLSAFSLDSHVDVGITNLGGVPPTIAQWAAAQLWSITSFLVRTVIDLFTWAFSLNLLAGTPGQGGGALSSVGQAVSSLYENVIGQSWMVAAILVAGIWGIWKALVQRRYTETAGALTVSVLFVVIALFFVYQPERTIGQASEWTNTMSLAFLSGANRGTIDRPDEAKRQVADQLFAAQIYEPWVVLEFGGLSHCVDTDRTDKDGFPRPVGPHDPTRDVCRDHVHQGRDGHGGYAERFLRYPLGSQERNTEYDALDRGEKPPFDRQFAGYEVDKTDTPAVDIQQAGGAFQRLTLAVVIFASSLGMVVLLGFLSLAVILAQVVALVLLGFAPVALVIGIFPRAGHEFFKSWLGKLATAVFIKALYSLVIAVVVAVAAALASATSSLGFLFSFALQGIFFWSIFIYRKQITARMVAATTGHYHGERPPQMTVIRQGANAATKPFSALVAIPRRKQDDDTVRQESVLAGTSHHDGAAPPTGGKPLPTGDGAGSRNASSTSKPGQPPTVAPTGSNGHGPSSLAQDLEAARQRRNGHAPGHTDQAAQSGPAPENGRDGDHGRREEPSVRVEPSPREAHEDVMRRARRLRKPQSQKAEKNPWELPS